MIFNSIIAILTIPEIHISLNYCSVVMNLFEWDLILSVIIQLSVIFFLSWIYAGSPISLICDLNTFELNF